MNSKKILVRKSKMKIVVKVRIGKKNRFNEKIGFRIIKIKLTDYIKSPRKPSVIGQMGK